MPGGRPSWTRRGALARVLALGLSLGSVSHAAAQAVDMAEVRRLAREPVETIFAGAPIGPEVASQ